MHRCRDPLLVDATPETWLPDDPVDFNWGATHPEIGCNQLRCGACGAAVRSLPRAAVADPGAPLAALYDADDLSAHPAIQHLPDDRGRLYLCRCAAWRAMTATPADSPDERGPHLPWGCAGHPPLLLPCTLDGLRVDEADLPSVARAALPEHWPPPLPPIDKDLRAFWLARLYHLLPEDRLREALGAAVAAELSAPEPAVRAGALFFFLWVPEATAAAELVRVARQHRDLFAGHADPRRPRNTLEERLIQAVEFVVRCVAPEASPASAAGLELLKDELVAGRNLADALYQVDRRDHGWVVAHAAQVLRATPDVMPDLVYLLRREPAGALLPLVQAFSSTPGVDRGALEAQLRSRLPPDVLAQALGLLGAPAS